MNAIRKIIRIDEDLCDGCGQCIPNCAEGALRIIEGKAKVIADKYCDGLGACLGHCPTGALTVIERAADAFDEEAVNELLAASGKPGLPAAPAHAPAHAPVQGGCPSQRLAVFAPRPASAPGSASPCACASGETPPPNIGHWPVQIRLVPPNAPFLTNADLVVTADCAPIAYPNFQAEFVAGKVVLMGCPKFDDPDAYRRRFQDILKNPSGPRNVTVVSMEVPCCAGLSHMLLEAAALAGRDIPVREVVIGIRGNVVENPLQPLHAASACGH